MVFYIFLIEFFGNIFRMDIDTPDVPVFFNYVPLASSDAKSRKFSTDWRRTRTSHDNVVPLYCTIQATSDIQAVFLFLVGNPNGNVKSAL